MKLGGIFRFELAYQLRRLPTWLFFATVTAVAFLGVRQNFLADALYDDFFLNSPFVIAMVTVLCGVIWLLTAGSVAGEAAARDVQTRMDPLTYTAPVRKFDYLGGRFLAAFVINAVILLGVPAGILLAVYLPGVEPVVIGPFRLAAYATAYFFIALPNAFVTTAIQFSAAALGRRVKASYLGSVFVFFQGYIVSTFVAIFFAKRELGKLLDPIGVLTIVSTLPKTWTPIEKSTRLVRLEGALLSNRLLWVGISVGALAFTYLRFRFVHRTSQNLWSRAGRVFRKVRGRLLAALRPSRPSPTPGASPPRKDLDHAPAPRAIVRNATPFPRRTFGFAIHVRQTLAFAWTSLRTIVLSGSGIVVWAGMALLMVVVMPEALQDQGMPRTPRTDYVVSLLGAPLTNPVTPWVVIQLLTIIYAGELMWREREAGLGEITDATPVPEWVSFLGKFLGLSFALAAWLALLTAAAMLVQVRMGNHDFQLGLYVQAIFGLRLGEYLLFALLVLVINVVFNQKAIAHLVAFMASSIIAFASMLGIEQNLIVYAGGPAWSYTEMRGFGGSLGPWLWFKLYWAAWALLLAVVARLLWVRGTEGSLATRIQLARRRITAASAATGAAALLLILASGGFIFYNTHVLNESHPASERAEQRAEYERRYKRYQRIAQPRVAGVNLRVEIDTARRSVDIRGTYELVNRSAAAIDLVQVGTVPGVDTSGVAFDRPSRRTLADDDRSFSIYALEKPLLPGDSLHLSFEVHRQSRGFRNGGADIFVVPNGTMFTIQQWMPAIGYQTNRELVTAGERRAQGLAPRPVVPTLDDVDALHAVSGAGAFEAVVGTAADQIAVAPGVLQRSWMERGRRYFRYVADAPIGEAAFFSAKYAVRKALWRPSSGSGQPVVIEIFHHPTHTAHLDRMLRSARASFDYDTKHFGPYPFSILRFIEHPGLGVGMHSDAMQINYSEGSASLNPAPGERGFDLAYAVIAHETAHQWWGGQLPYAAVEGLGLLTESPAWYTAMGVVKQSKGLEELRRLQKFFRQPYPILPIRQSVPLLRALDPYASYRKGPAALWALRDAIGEERVNSAYRRLLEKHRSGEPPLPTSLDLYRELKAVTPPDSQSLLHDLFEANTFWEMKTERATAQQTAEGTWQVTLDLDARKEVVNPAGVATAVLMDDLVEIGVFAPAENGEDQGKPLYLHKHRIGAGKQTITVTVPGKPERAGIDPYHLLIEWERDDNVRKVKS